MMGDGRKFVLDNTLDELYSQLNPELFFRANRQFIVSQKSVVDISIWFGSKVSVNLNVEVPERIIVSKARVTEFKQWFTK
jgi:two-component system, LytTR family, response regulator LytT